MSNAANKLPALLIVITPSPPCPYKSSRPLV